MKSKDLLIKPHRRFNPLTGEWILVSPGRTSRPWKGKVESLPDAARPAYDPSCYLCPGNVRANGERNPDYSATFAFDNDYSALLPDTPADKFDKKELLVARGEPGTCRVICFLPRHDLTLAEMSVEDIARVVKVWSDEYKHLGKNPAVNHVQIFENKGDMMGASNPHPHCQIWAQASIPVEPTKELTRMKMYFKEKKSCLLCDYLDIESNEHERIVLENRSFAVIVPFWAVWPFETLLLPKRHVGSLLDFSRQEGLDYADILKRLTVKYDNIFEVPFPYSSGIHQSPTDGKKHGYVHFHMHFYPPLLRSATVRKFMVGYEMLGNPQRDITAEETAERLRGLPEIHYKESRK